MHLEETHTVSAIAVVDLANELIKRDLLSLRGLSNISSTAMVLYQSHQQGLSITEKRLPEVDFLSLWNVANKQLHLPYLGIDIGKTVNVNAKGILANWLSCCETLSQAFSIFQENIRLLNQSECWSVREHAGTTKFTFKFSSMHRYPTMAIERSMVALLAWSNYFSSTKLNIISAAFAFDEPSYSNLYNDIFGSNIEFDSNENYIEVLTEQLETPISGANDYLRDLLEKQAGNIDLRSSQKHPTKTKIQALLTLDLAKYSKLDAVVEALHMSRTSLYRKLKDEQSAFSELVFLERVNHLGKIDRVGTHSAVITESLGFKDVSSYYKFIKKM